MTVQTRFSKYVNESLTAEKCEQSVLACTIDTSSKGGADRILSAGAQVSSLKAVAADGQVTVSGKLNVKAVYLTPEGTPDSVDYVSDFSKTLVCPSVGQESAVTVRAEVVDVQAAVEGDSIRMQTVVSICPYAVTKKEYDLLEEADGAFVKRTESKFARFAGFVEAACPVNEQYATGAVVEKVLSFNCTADVCKVTSDNAGAVVEGEVCAVIVYVSDGKAVQKNLTMPYVCRMDVGENAKADVVAEVSGCRLVIGGPATENVFEVSADVALTAAVYESYGAQLISDAYCPVKELKISRLCLSYDDYLDTARTRERISGSVETDDGVGISRIVCALEKDNAIATVEIRDDKAYVDGVLAVTVIYLSDNDDYKSVDVDLPYSVQIALCEGVKKTDVKASACDVFAKVKRDSEIEVNATVCVSAVCYGESVICAVDGVEEGADLKPCEDSVAIYYAKKGDTLWDIAKKLSMSPESIAEQNPDVGERVQQDVNVVVYREVAV